MHRIAALLLLVSASALAQPAPVRQFLLRMEPVRKDFTLQNMNEEERKTAGEHFAYLKGLYSAGTLTFAGQAFDPAGLWGVVVVNAASREEALEVLNGDPGVKAKMFRGSVIPFRTMLERGAPR